MEQNNAGSRGDRARCWRQGRGQEHRRTKGWARRAWRDLGQGVGERAAPATGLWSSIRFGNGALHAVQRQHVGESH